MAPPKRQTNSSMSRTGSSSEVSSASSWRRVRRKQRAVMVSASDTGGLLVGSGGGVPGHDQEHVVQGRGVHGEAPHRGALRVELVEQGPDVRGGPVGRDADGQVVRVGGDYPAAGVPGDTV